LASFATPITAFGYKPKSFKFHPDGAEIETVSSAPETATLAAAWVVVVLIAVVAAVVVVLVVVEAVVVFLLPHPASWSMIMENNISAMPVAINFFLCCKNFM
jgi:hypothetical protein